MEIDLSPVLDVGIDLLAFVCMALGSWAIARLGRKFGLDADDRVRIYFSPALAGGIGWATEQARKRSADIALVEVRGRLVAEASNYVIERVPDALNRFGLDREGIEKLIEARLGGA